MTILLQHVSNIGAGLGAAVMSLLFLYSLGLMLTPAKHIARIQRSAHAAILGAGATVIWCWYGVKLNIPLLDAFPLLFWLTALLLVFRWKVIVAALVDPALLRKGLRLLALFSVLYVISYVFLMPAGSSDYLPIVRIGNNDILNYVISASYLQRLGASNIAGFSFIDSPSRILTFTPAVYDTIVAMSMYFNGETMRAAMPTLFATVALIGCVVAGLARTAFMLPGWMAVGLGALLISGPFFRYIAGNYFLSQLMATLIVLLLLARTTKILTEKMPKAIPSLVLWSAPYHFLLFYTYPPLFIIGLGLQFGFVVIFHILAFIVPHDEPTGSLAAFGKVMAQWVVVIIASIVMVFLSDPGNFRDTASFLGHVSRRGVGGWALDLISPLAILGLPFPLQIRGLGGQLLLAALVAVTVCWIGYVYLMRARSTRSLAGLAFFALACASFVSYFAYFLYVGASYQQWKLASYLPLIFSFAIFAALTAIMLPSTKSMTGDTRANWWRYTGIGMIYMVPVVGNMAFHAYFESPVEKFSSRFANLRALEMIGGSSDIYIEMADYSSAFFPIYFIRNKTLHLLSPSYFPQEELKIDHVSPQKPLFIQGRECDIDSSNISISGLGCLFLRPPSFRIGAKQSFSQKLLGEVKSSGLSGVEPWGRWSDGKRVELILLFGADDLSRNPVGFINFNVQPFLFGPIKAQQILFTWGNGRRVHAVVDEAGWISLPYSRRDWGGFEAREITITLDLPDAVAPHDVDPKFGEDRRLAIGFVAVSISNKAMGKIVGR